MEELKASELIAIAALASGKTINQAATEAGVNERTIDRWLKKPEFKAELRSIVTTTYRSQLNQLQSLLCRGIERLSQILDDEQTTAPDIIRTVHLLLSAADRYQESSLTERVENLELEINNEV
ncbi:helix-turn-helix domain-containing protein [Myxosarcina sp. GI1]|uniref:helix-turn-helix domain-containing protein n=1 Tax=Myxosarcina sp. GI1 TaxID=1541065 RepID=UPI00055AA5EA|nr:helix-turn-helix domain-containing protein [Myxosarcina sp. GI1]